MVYKLKSGENNAFSFCEDDKVKSVLQNIALILSTRKGSVPMYRDFGVDMSFVDKPIPAAEVLMRAAVAEAIEEFEPRAKLLNVDFDGNQNVILEVEI